MRARSFIGLLLCLAACCALGFVASGCGSSSATLDPVAQAAEVTQHAGGSKMAITANVSSPGLTTPITIGGSGFFNYKTKEGSFSLTMSGLPAVAGLTDGGDLTLQERIKATTVYVGSELFDGKLPNGAHWVKLDLARFGASYGLSLEQLTGGEANFGELLGYLKASAGGVKLVGHDEVRGVATTRYRGNIDLEKIVDQAPETARSQLRAALAKVISQTGIKLVPVEVWVDAQSRVRRFSLSLSISEKGQTLSTQVSVDLYDFGPTPTVVAPPDGETYDVTQAALGGLSQAG
jgi:hypothetical protein